MATGGMGTVPSSTVSEGRRAVEVGANQLGPFDEALTLLGLETSPRPSRSPRRELVREAINVPDTVRRFYEHPNLVNRIGQPWSNDLLPPDRAQLVRDDPRVSQLVGPALLIMIENQGVCRWVAPLEAGEDPPVYVVGSPDLASGERIVQFVPAFSAFVHVLAWHTHLETVASQTSSLQAQASPIDDVSLELLRTRFREVEQWDGWPGGVNHIFEGSGSYIELWGAPDQCDWWVTADTHEQLERVTAELLPLSNLAESMWSNDEVGTRILQIARGP